MREGEKIDPTNEPVKKIKTVHKKRMRYTGAGFVGGPDVRKGRGEAHLQEVGKAVNKKDYKPLTKTVGGLNPTETQILYNFCENFPHTAFTPIGPRGRVIGGSEALIMTEALTKFEASGLIIRVGEKIEVTKKALKLFERNE